MSKSNSSQERTGSTELHELGHPLESSGQAEIIVTGNFGFFNAKPMMVNFMTKFGNASDFNLGNGK
ncbi:MAG: hypothetical protein COB51_09065 [Moraxellaceae bacterium]|nr:MAG: hypothetical protein COB51_09065 [Moraxellaceae bacterium]